MFGGEASDKKVKVLSGGEEAVWQNDKIVAGTG